MTISATLSATGLDIINKAGVILGIKDKVLPLSPEDRSSLFSGLNYLVKTLQVNYHLWTETQAVIPLQLGVSEYKLGPGGTVAVNKDEFLKLTTDTITPIGFTLNVTGAINSGDNIGIIHASGSVQWTTVASYTAGAVIIDDVLTAIVPASSTVYVYANIIERPVKIVNGRYQSGLTSMKLPTTKWNSTQFYESDDSETGSVQAWFYSPQLVNGTLSIFKKPVDNNALLNITYIRPINVTSDNGDSVDFPSEWFLPLTYMLAEQSLTEFTTPDQAAEEIKALSAKYSAIIGIVPLGKLQPKPEAGA